MAMHLGIGTALRGKSRGGGKGLGGFAQAAIVPKAHAADREKEGQFTFGIQIPEIALGPFLLGGDRKGPFAVVIIVEGVQPVAGGLDVEAFALALPPDEKMAFGRD